MKVRIIRGTVAGGQAIEVGEVYDGPDAKMLVQIGKAVEIDEAPEPLPPIETKQTKDDEGRPTVEPVEYKSPGGRKVGSRKHR